MNYFQIKGALEKVKEKKPLIHCITNYVTVNDCANIILAGKGANKNSVPVIFDSVGAAASASRRSNASKILREVKMFVIRGNMTEIKTLLEMEGSSTFRVKLIDAVYNMNSEELMKRGKIHE